MKTWRVSVYRNDSHTPVVYEDVKHAWWEHGRYIIAQYVNSKEGGEHFYWTWPGERISHVKEERWVTGMVVNAT
jgi:hypothetical protein